MIKCTGVHKLQLCLGVWGKLRQIVLIVPRILSSIVGARTWYLPHYPAINQNKPGKVRIVFDAAAEYNGTSLNKNLLQGPDSTNCLIGVLLRFRQENTAIVADIESMFHQVRVREEDRESLWFLWWDESTGDSLEEYVMTVHICGATDSPCVANSTLKRTADDNEKDFDAITVQTLRRNFYVDHLLKTLPTPATATRLASQLIELCTKGGLIWQSLWAMIVTYWLKYLLRRELCQP